MKKVWEKFLFSFLLLSYVLVVFFFAVLNREPSVKNPVRLNLFWSYFQTGTESYKDNLLNIVLFVPIGLLTGLIADRFRLGKALLVGLFVSMAIEFSQLIWKRGVFDVDDLFNNAVGTVIGGLIVLLWMNIWRNNTDKETCG